MLAQCDLFMAEVFELLAPDAQVRSLSDPRLPESETALPALRRIRAAASDRTKGIVQEVSASTVVQVLSATSWPVVLQNSSALSAHDMFDKI